jgi:hypothetical protein
LILRVIKRIFIEKNANFVQNIGLQKKIIVDPVTSFFDPKFIGRLVTKQSTVSLLKQQQV